MRIKDKRSKNQAWRHSSGPAERDAIRLHDKIAAFEDFEENILPALRKDLKAGLTPKQIREKYQSIVQARLITDVLRTEDPKEAAAIGKDLLDRVEGKATEKKEVTHRFKDMSDKELDAILQSEEQDLEDMQTRFTKQ